MTTSTLRRSTPALAAFFAAIAVGACSDIEKAKPKPMPVRAEGFELNTPPIMNGTIGSQAQVAGNRPVLVRGYGLVVGLNGTGSRDLPPELRAYMLGEMAKRGVGRDPFGGTGMTGSELLDSPDTAVVVVEAVIPAGSTKGKRFDVRVVADPRTGTTSLEKGVLYTTELRPPSPGELLPRTEGSQRFPIATAQGPVFVNPFVDSDTTTINTTTARILEGGLVQRDIPIKLRLARPSHNLAASMERAINTRFPEEYDPIRRTHVKAARGESDDSIILSVPPSYREEPQDFIELVQHTTIRLVGPESVATSVRRFLESEPGAAYSASWRWRALGKRALPVIRDLYDSPNGLTRLAALRAGAGLDDALAIAPLIDLMRTGPADLAGEAVDLLAAMGFNLTIDAALRGMLDASNVELRLRAYEALAKRGDPWMDRYEVEGKFRLDVVDCPVPMIYITQLNQPRIVLFGRGLELERPLSVDAWSSRLLVKESERQGLVDVYYRPEGANRAVVEEFPAALPDFIMRLATPMSAFEAAKPGLGLSYSETVGAVYQIWKQHYIPADFKAEQDRILAAIRDFEREMTGDDRPEFGDPDFDEIYPETTPRGETGAPAGETGAPPADTAAGAVDGFNWIEH